MICDICVEESKKHILCLSCNLDVCLSCFERFQIESSNDEIQCMQCNKAFDDDYLFINLTHTRLSKLKNRKKQQLFEKEQIHFPQTQVFVKYDNFIQNEISDMLDSNVKEMVKIHKMCLKDELNLEELSIEEGNMYLYNRKKVGHLSRVVNFLKKIVNSWNCECSIYKPRYRNYIFNCKYTDIQPVEFFRKYIPTEIYNNVNILNRNLRYLQADVINTESSDSNKFEHIFSCSQENCKGFVMKKDWLCGLCNTQYCKKCLKTTTDTHECLEDDVKTASMLLNTSKPCPSCAARIHKISGCDQMFCTNCKTAFSWKTLKIETGIVHNPHFFEWQNRAGFGINNDDPCGRPPAFVIINHCEKLYDFRFHQNVVSEECDLELESHVDFLSYIITIHRLCAHISAVEILRRFNTEPPSQYFNIDLRIKYLNGRISEEHMKNVLHRRFKSVRVNIRRVQVLQLFITVSNDILRRLLLLQDNSIKSRKQFRDEFEQLFNYVEECFINLSKIYKMAMPIVKVGLANKTNSRYLYDFNQDKFTGYLLMKKWK